MRDVLNGSLVGRTKNHKTWCANIYRQVTGKISWFTVHARRSKDNQLDDKKNTEKMT